MSDTLTVLVGTFFATGPAVAEATEKALAALGAAMTEECAAEYACVLDGVKAAVPLLAYARALRAVRVQVGGEEACVAFDGSEAFEPEEGDPFAVLGELPVKAEQAGVRLVVRDAAWARTLGPVARLAAAGTERVTVEVVEEGA